MAKQIGPIGMSGKLGDITGVEIDGEKYFKMGGGPSTHQWHNAPGMVRSRENASVFGAASMIGANIYLGLSKPIRQLCGPYAHNRILAELVKGARDIGTGRLPEHYPAEIAAQRLLHLQLGEDPKAARKRLQRIEGRTDIPPKKRAAARDKAMQADAKRFLRATHDPATGKVKVTGLIDTAQRITLREKEQLQFRLHVSLVKVTGLERAQSTSSKAEGTRKYEFQGGEPRALRIDVSSEWLPCSQGTDLEDGLDIAVPTQLPDGSTALVIVGVEWRALHGFRIRMLRSAGIVHIAGIIYAPGSQSQTAAIRTRQRARSTAQRTRRILLINKLREQVHGAPPPKQRLRTAVRSIERKLRSLVV